MNESIRASLKKTVADYRLPRYAELPNVGLYLDQVAKYINGFLEPIGCSEITTSMISNYVKKKIIDNPIKKQYYREQIAYLIFIAMAKSVLSLEDIKLMIHLQKMTYMPEKAYNYFVEELENVLKIVFEGGTDYKELGSDRTREKTMLRNTVIAISHKVYLDLVFAEVRAEEEL